MILAGQKPMPKALPRDASQLVQILIFVIGYYATHVLMSIVTRQCERQTDRKKNRAQEHTENKDAYFWTTVRHQSVRII